jgi:cell division septum initiation protein DivIVA
MARAIKMTQNFANLKKGEVLPNCSSQLAQKLVNRRKVAEFVDAKPGDGAQKLVAGAQAAVKDARAKSVEIIDKANEDAKAIVEGAKLEAEKILEEAKKNVKNS